MKLYDYFALLEEEIPQGNIIKNFKIEISSVQVAEDGIKSSQELGSCNVATMIKKIREEIKVFFDTYKLDMRALLNIEWVYDSKFYKFVLASKDGKKDFDISSATLGSKNIIGNLSSVKNVEDFLEFVGGQEWTKLK